MTKLAPYRGANPLCPKCENALPPGIYCNAEWSSCQHTANNQKPKEPHLVRQCLVCAVILYEHTADYKPPPKDTPRDLFLAETTRALREQYPGDKGEALAIELERRLPFDKKPEPKPSEPEPKKPFWAIFS